MDYITVKEATVKWGITIHRVQVVCVQDKIPGAVRFANTWTIPKDVVKPMDRGYKRDKNQMLEYNA
ncbi:MAG: DNA-binding protein [Ruminiclostridium sp.]|nr:DNA-binding protein [Ruminiclostridium sp.]